LNAGRNEHKEEAQEVDIKVEE